VPSAAEVSNSDSVLLLELPSMKVHLALQHLKRGSATHSHVKRIVCSADGADGAVAASDAMAELGSVGNG